MNKRAIKLPFIFVSKTLLYLIKAPLFALKCIFLGIAFFAWNLLKVIYIISKLLIQSLLYFCKCLGLGFYKIFNKTDDVILAFGNYLYHGMVFISLLIYKIFHFIFMIISKVLTYIIKAIIFISMYFYKILYYVISLIIKFLSYSILGFYLSIIKLCLYIYYGIHSISLLLAVPINYIYKGLVVTLKFIYKIIYSFSLYFYRGLRYTTLLLIKPLRYFSYGISVTFYLIFKSFKKLWSYVGKGIMDVKNKLGKLLIKPPKPKKIVVPKPTAALKKPTKEAVYRPVVKEKKKAKVTPIKKRDKYRKTTHYKKKTIKQHVYKPSKLFLTLYKAFILFPRLIYRFISYLFIGIAFIFYAIYRFIRYVIIGFILPYRLIFGFIGGPLQKVIIKNMRTSKIHQEERAVQKFLEKKERDQLRLEQIKVRNERIRNKDMDKQKRSMILATVEKETFENKLKYIFNQLKTLPKRIKQRLKEEAKYSPLAQAFTSERNVPGRQMVIDYEGVDAIKTDKKLLYEYVVRDPNTGKIVKGYFDAYSTVEVHSFLISEGYEVYSIKTSPLIQLLHSNVSVANRRIKINDLIFMLTQLSTYIKAGLPLVDSLKILARQYQKTKYLPIFKAIIYDLTMGENFSAALAKQNVAFPRLLINMVKTAEMTGELPETLDDMVNYFTETEQTKKQMISALTYPTIVLVMAIGVLTFIMIYVVPKFVGIYQTMDNASIPGFTLLIVKISNFMQANAIYMGIGFIVLVLLARYLYVNVKAFRYLFQWLGMHIPVMGNILIYNEVTMFTKTFSSLLSHNVFITDSMEILSRVTNNEIYKILIANTIDNLNKGERISLAFEHAWAFPIPAYEMLVTGEKTGQLPEMMKKVSDYYQDLHRNSVSRLKALIEPALIVFLTAVVGVIVMAVVVPMFNMYSSISNY